MDIALNQHKVIIDDLLAGRSAQAADALERHILDMKERIIAELAAGPEPNGEVVTDPAPASA